jgi:hypothetical protein
VRFGRPRTRRALVQITTQFLDFALQTQEQLIQPRLHVRDELVDPRTYFIQRAPRTRPDLGHGLIDTRVELLQSAPDFRSHIVNGRLDPSLQLLHRIAPSPPLDIAGPTRILHSRPPGNYVTAAAPLFRLPYAACRTAFHRTVCAAPSGSKPRCRRIACAPAKTTGSGQPPRRAEGSMSARPRPMCMLTSTQPVSDRRTSQHIPRRPMATAERMA